MPPILIFALLGVIVFGIAVMLYHAFTFPLPQAPPVPVDPLPIDADAAAAHLAAALRVQTISHGPDAPIEADAFAALHELLAATYPRVHAALTRREFGPSLLYEWTGDHPALPPVVFLAHQDVVPVPEEELPLWTYPPFDGAIADGYVWGRGALDVKCQLTGLLDAVERLLAAGFQPARTIYLAFGHDEEIDGSNGAKQIAAWMQAQRIRPAAVLDEGGMVIEGVLDGVQTPMALIGTAEKGEVTFELTVTGEPGHASMPPRHTTAGVLTHALAAVEAHPMPADVTQLRSLLRHLGTYTPFLYRVIFGNLWLLGGVAARVLSGGAQTNATIRTTTAITMLRGGVKSNVLPREAKAVVNCRLLPGDDLADVQGHLRRVTQRVTRGAPITITPLADGRPASPVSPATGPAYAKLVGVARGMFDGIPAAPYLMLGASDSRHYTQVCEHVYRFQPLHLDSDDLGRIHGIDERIRVDGLAQMVAFYTALMQVWGGDW